MKSGIFPVVFLLLFATPRSQGQEYTVQAIDADTGKGLSGIRIILRYECVFTGSGIATKEHCKFVRKKTDHNGVAHFPDAGRLSNIDDIYPWSVAYAEVCCDISHPVVPGTGTITFKR